jgi:hypothetical protein
VTGSQDACNEQNGSGRDGGDPNKARTTQQLPLGLAEAEPSAPALRLKYDELAVMHRRHVRSRSSRWPDRAKPSLSARFLLNPIFFICAQFIETDRGFALALSCLILQ